MRLYHPKTLRILAQRKDISKRFSVTAWSEIFKWVASGKPHPKMFIDNLYDLGAYLRLVYNLAQAKDCNLDITKIKSLGSEIEDGFNETVYPFWEVEKHYFDNNYFFSDLCSLYYKGVNLFPDAFKKNWRKYVPVESHKEIHRQITKTLTNAQSK